MPAPNDVSQPTRWWLDLPLRMDGTARRKYVVGMALSMADALLWALPLALSAWIVRSLMLGDWSTGQFGLATIAVVVSFALRLWLLPLSLHLGFLAGFGGVAALRLELLAHLRSLSFETAATVAAGGLSDLVTNRFRWLEEQVAYGVGRQVGQATLAAAIVMMLAVFDVRMLLGILLVGLCGGLAYRLIDGAFERLSRAQGDMLAATSDGLIEFVTGLPVLRTFDRVGGQHGDYRRRVDALHDFYRKTIWRLAPLVSAVRIILDLCLFALLALSVGLYAGGSLASSDFVVIVMLLLLLQVPVDGLIAEGFRLRMADDAILRAARVLALPPMPDGPSTPGVVGDIEFESVRFAFDGGKPIFENLAATIPAGKMTAIVGPSGAGKSTLLKLIARFCDVQHGAIRIGGQDIRDIALDDHLRRISLLAQEPFLFNDTVLANLRMANARASDADCMAAARAAHCDFVEQLPSGFNTVLGENGGGLSGGERLRLTIARALLKGAPIILLDEPTSALDVQSEFYIRQALGTLCRGRTVVVVAHRLSTIREADHLLVMDQGRIVDAGEEADLYQRCALYRDLWHAQAERVRWRLRADSETIRGS